MQTIEQKLNARENRTLACNDRFLDAMDVRIARKEDAEKQVGVLIREGKQVFYVMPVGGRYREGSKADLVDFLVRNNYA